MLGQTPPPVTFLQPVEVKALLLDPARKDHLLVLDVRDEDFDGAHVKATNFLNIPSADLGCSRVMDEFIRLHLHDDIEMVIVHCYLSQQRGPTTARRLANRLSQLNRNGRPEVAVMAHGWRRFSHMFGGDETLIQKPC